MGFETRVLVNLPSDETAYKWQHLDLAQACLTPKTTVIFTIMPSLFTIYTSVKQPGSGSETYVLNDIIILRTLSIQRAENRK